MIICQRSQMTFSQNMKRENFDVCQWMSWNHSKIGAHHFYFVSPQQCLYVCRAAKAVDTAAPCDMNDICSMMRLKTKNDQTRSPLELIEVPLRGSSIRKNQSMAFPIFKAKLCACFKLMSHSLDFMFRLTVNRMVIDWSLFFLNNSFIICLVTAYREVSWVQGATVLGQQMVLFSHLFFIQRRMQQFTLRQTPGHRSEPFYPRAEPS